MFLRKNLMLKIQYHYAELAGVSFFSKLPPIHRKYLINSGLHWISCPNVESLQSGEQYCFYAQEINDNLPTGFIFCKQRSDGWLYFGLVRFDYRFYLRGSVANARLPILAGDIIHALRSHFSACFSRKAPRDKLGLQFCKQANPNTSLPKRESFGCFLDCPFPSEQTEHVIKPELPLWLPRRGNCTSLRRSNCERILTTAGWPRSRAFRDLGIPSSVRDLAAFSRSKQMRAAQLKLRLKATPSRTSMSSSRVSNTARPVAPGEPLNERFFHSNRKFV